MPVANLNIEYIYHRICFVSFSSHNDNDFVNVRHSIDPRTFLERFCEKFVETRLKSIVLPRNENATIAPETIQAVLVGTRKLNGLYRFKIPARI